MGENRLEMHCKQKESLKVVIVLERNQRRYRKTEERGGGKGRRREAKNYLHGPLEFCSF